MELRSELTPADYTAFHRCYYYRYRLKRSIAINMFAAALLTYLSSHGMDWSMERFFISYAVSVFAYQMLSRRRHFWSW